MLPICPTLLGLGLGFGLGQNLSKGTFRFSQNSNFHIAEVKMLNSTAAHIEDTQGSDMDDHEIARVRKTRKQRIDRVKARGAKDPGRFFASPYAAIVCMIIALGSVVGFWRGVPSWALLGIGIGAVLIIVIAGFFWRSSKQ